MIGGHQNAKTEKDQSIFGSYQKILKKRNELKWKNIDRNVHHKTWE